MIKLLQIRIFFALFVAFVFGYGAYAALDFPFLARIFPFYISLFCFFLACINSILELRRGVRRLDRPGSGFADLEAAWEIPMSVVLRRFCAYLGVFVLLYAGIRLVGYPLSITIFIILFYRFVTRTNWLLAMVAGAAGLGFVALVAELMVIDWPSGLMQNWLDLPWPFG
jgi:putative tricarboxylic transport membrane protein